MSAHHLRKAVHFLATTPGSLESRMRFALDEFAACHDWERLSPLARDAYQALRDDLMRIANLKSEGQVNHLAGNLTDEELSNVADRILKLYELALTNA